MTSLMTFIHSFIFTQQIARQISIIDYELLLQIKPKELLSLSWQSNKNNNKDNNNVLQMITHFNQVFVHYI